MYRFTLPALCVAAPSLSLLGCISVPVSAEEKIEKSTESAKSVEKDHTKAVHWYRQAAEQGDAAVQSILGWMYWHGEGVEKDDTQALHWYRQAAEQGDSRAFRWLRQAAEQGHIKAQEQLDRLER
ncbi:MAG: sel1 repeat family protein [Cellvibrionales bacterium]|nr:sel1 repeat family protein [Cellvibrionales bacterium]